MGAYPRRDGIPRRPFHRADAGLSRAGFKRPHEYTGRAMRELELAHEKGRRHSCPRKENFCHGKNVREGLETGQGESTGKVDLCIFAGEQCSPLQYKIQAQPTDKIKNSLFIPSTHRLHPRCPVSATPTAFASRIGQFPRGSP